ncbi:Rho-GAP domain-containing protein [Entamoeba marina]
MSENFVSLPLFEETTLINDYCSSVDNQTPLDLKIHNFTDNPQVDATDNPTHSNNDTAELTNTSKEQHGEDATTQQRKNISPPVFLDEEFMHTICNRKDSKLSKTTIFDLETTDLCIPTIFNNSLVPIEGDEKYQIELSEAKSTSFPEFNSNVIGFVGCDRSDHPIVVFHQDSLVDLTYDFAQRFYLFFIKTLDQIAHSNYVVIYINEHYTLPYQFLYYLYQRLPSIYRKNLHKVYSFLQPIHKPTIPQYLSQDELNKFQVVSNLYDFYQEVPIGTVKIPLSLAEPITSHHPLFGIPLIDVMEHPFRGSTYTPLIIESSIVYFSTKVETLSEEGLFRMNGSKIRTDQIVSEFNQGLRSAFDFDEDPHVVCTVLKQFLRELPIPLLTYTIGEQISDVFNNTEPIQNKDLIFLLSKMPNENKTVLSHLVILGRIISSHSSENKMTSSNMGIIFGPCIYWTETLDLDAIARCKNINTFFTYLMDNAEELLGSS